MKKLFYLLGITATMLVFSGVMTAAVAIVALPLQALAPRSEKTLTGVVAPDSSPYGRTYAEWSASWWQWAYSIPAATSPLLDTTGANAAIGQDGPVCFLADALCITTASNQCQHIVVTRDVTVPSGKALCFPVHAAEWDNLGYNPPPSVKQLRARTKEYQDGVLAMSASLDGVDVPDLDPMTSPYRVASPVFSYCLPDGNGQAADCCSACGSRTVSVAVSDGVFLMLAPLPPGRHTLRFSATSSTDSSLHMTYNITVQEP
ncbi:MAG: hypothetical protein U0822_17420 [Anaerolineae bacterium]